MSVELMEKLEPKDATFNELMNGNYPWWENLKKDEDISIQIRKENYIDVYYNGGAILKKLKYNKTDKTFYAEIHIEYIPLKKEKDYIGLTLNEKGVNFKEPKKNQSKKSQDIKNKNIGPMVMAFSQFNESELKAVKNKVKIHFDAKTEKAIQFKYATSDPCIIDAEFQFNEDDEKSRIDLVRLDTSIKKIVLIEVKTIDDGRLFFEQEDTRGI
jgi:hypothetical protein